VYFAAYPRQIANGTTHILNVHSTGLIWINGSVDLSTVNGDSGHTPDAVPQDSAPADLIDKQAILATMLKCGVAVPANDQTPDWAEPLAEDVALNHWQKV